MQLRVAAVLAVAVALVYVWFGVLKVAGVSPVEGLLRTLPLGPSWAIVALGVFEVAVGVMLLWGRWPWAVFVLVATHVAGTFLVFLFVPERAFQDGRPAQLTIIGEFVVKNIVIVAAVWAATVLRTRPPTA